MSDSTLFVATAPHHLSTGYLPYNSMLATTSWLRLGCVRRIDLPRFAEMRFINYEDLSSTGRPGSLGVRGSNPLSSTISPGPVRARASLRLVPHQCPAADLEILGDVPLAAIPATLLDRRWLLAAAPLAHPTVDDHVAGLIVEYVLEVRVSQSFCSRNDQEQTGRACLRGPHGHLPPPPVRERRPNGFHLANVAPNDHGVDNGRARIRLLTGAHGRLEGRATLAASTRAPLRS